MDDWATLWFDSHGPIPVHVADPNDAEAQMTATGGKKRKTVLKNKRGNEKISRNAPCPCGSGKKYKRCCLNKPESIQTPDQQYAKKNRIRIKTPGEIEGIRRAGQLVIETLDLVAPHIHPGTTTDEINTLVHDFTLGPRSDSRAAELPRIS
jgi:hypothetical protein